MTGGQAVVQSLIANEVKIISGLIVTLIVLVDALYDAADITYIGCQA